jgi:hypothetical protein
MESGMFQILTEEKRREIVINYLSNNAGCTAEDIVNGQKTIGRVKVFKILRDLKKEEIINSRVSLEDKRKILLFINGDIPLIAIPRELDEIEKLLNPILTDLLKDLMPFALDSKMRDSKGRYHSSEDYRYNFVHSIVPIQIIIDLIDHIYSKKAFDWSSHIKDKESLDRLHMSCFLRIHEFQRKLTNIVDKTITKNAELRENILEDTLGYPTPDFGTAVLEISEMGMLKTAKPLLQFLAKISGNYSILLHD